MVDSVEIQVRIMGKQVEMSSHEILDARLDGHSEPRNHLEADDEQELTDEVDACGVHRQRVHVWVELSAPEHVGEYFREEERCNDLNMNGAVSTVCIGYMDYALLDKRMRANTRGIPRGHAATLQRAK